MFLGPKEQSHWDGSFEYPQRMFLFRNKKLIFLFNLTKGLSLYYFVKVKKKAKIRNQYNQVSQSDKNTRKHHTQESQEISPFPAGDQKAARNRQDGITKTNMKHK